MKAVKRNFLGLKYSTYKYRPHTSKSYLLQSTHYSLCCLPCFHCHMSHFTRSYARAEHSAGYMAHKYASPQVDGPIRGSTPGNLKTRHSANPWVARASRIKPRAADS